MTSRIRAWGARKTAPNNVAEIRRYSSTVAAQLGMMKDLPSVACLLQDQAKKISGLTKAPYCSPMLRLHLIPDSVKRHSRMPSWNSDSAPRDVVLIVVRRLEV